MRKKHPIYCISLLVWISSCYAELNGPNDRGLWIEGNCVVELPYDWSLQLLTSQRWGDNYTLYWFQGYTTIFFYNVAKLYSPSNVFVKLLAGGGYDGALFRERSEKRRWFYMHRPLIEFQLFTQLSAWQIMHRFRTEYRMFTSNNQRRRDHAVVRYRVTILSPWEWTLIHIKPYISNEFFFRESTELESGYHQNRLRLGVQTDWSKDLFSLAYFWQWRALKRREEWIDTYDIGCMFMLQF